ncbi:class III lanthipeptide [Streptomyces sp. bgisy022]
MSVLKLQTLQPSTSAAARGPLSITSSSSTCCSAEQPQ